jgi:hypothetical protein
MSDPYLSKSNSLLYKDIRVCCSHKRRDTSPNTGPQPSTRIKEVFFLLLFSKGIFSLPSTISTLFFFFFFLFIYYYFLFMFKVGSRVENEAGVRNEESDQRESLKK